MKVIPGNRRTWWRLFQELVVCTKLDIRGGCRISSQGGGGALEKIAPSGGRRENVGVFRVKNHDFTPKNQNFSNIRGVRAGCAPGTPPPWIRPWIYIFFALISIRISLMVYLRKHCICLALLPPHFGLKFSNRILFWLHEYVLRLANA